MRRLLVVLAATLLGVPAVGLAQAPSFGLKGGLNMADFSGRRIVDSEYRSGLTLGAFVSIPVSAAIAIQPEVIFSQKGAGSAAYDYDDFPQDGGAAPPLGVYLTEETRHDYLEIPVLVKLSPSLPGDAVRTIFFAGPSVGFLLGAKEVYDTDYEEHLNSTDFGFIIGGGVEFGRLSLDARYNLGLSSIARDFDSDIGLIPGDIKNRAFTVLVGFRLF